MTKEHLTFNCIKEISLDAAYVKWNNSHLRLKMNMEFGDYLEGLKKLLKYKII